MEFDESVTDFDESEVMCFAEYEKWIKIGLYKLEPNGHLVKLERTSAKTIILAKKKVPTKLQFNFNGQKWTCQQPQY